MSEAFVRKNVKLSLEFDGYVARHPQLFERIPNGAYVVITVRGDKAFNKDSISMVRNIKRKKVVEAHKTDSRWTIRPLKLQAA